MKNKCKECRHYNSGNGTCDLKKVSMGGDGRVTYLDRIFCKPYIRKEN